MGVRRTRINRESICARAVETGVLHAEIRGTIKDFGLSDAYTLATTRNLSAKVLMGNPHFKDTEDAMMI